MVLWDGWLRGQSLKAIGRTFGKPSSLLIACWPPVLRRPVETTTHNGHDCRHSIWSSIERHRRSAQKLDLSPSVSHMLV
jgi:hypothetical protein